MSETPVRFAALFPGQGSQWVGMAKDLREHFPFTREIFEEASDALSLDLFKLCQEGPADDLQLTFNAQPSILTISYAWFRVLKHHLDFKPVSGAGHSLGEYSALCASGAMTLTEAVRLVRKRGELMQSAVPAGRGKMAALIGLDDEKAKQLCQEATQEDSIVTCANFNAPSQVVIAGHTAAVERAEALAANPERPELKARKVIPLKVSAPFHCPLMKPVAEAFTASLQAVPWKNRTFSIAHNLDAKMRREGDLVPLLRDQIDHSVLWTQCQKALSDGGATHFVEMGPGKVLVGLGRRIVDEGSFFALDSLTDFQAFEKVYKETHK